MKRFPSKIGPELAVPLTVLLGGMLIWLVYDRDWVGTVFTTSIITLVAYTFSTTYYQIESSTLRVKCVFFINQSININSIKVITETWNPTGAPAVSLDRLDMSYSQFDHVLVSPKDKKRSIDELLNVNPGIIVRLKS